MCPLGLGTWRATALSPSTPKSRKPATREKCPSLGRRKTHSLSFLVLWLDSPAYNESEPPCQSRVMRQSLFGKIFTDTPGRHHDRTVMSTNITSKYRASKFPPPPKTLSLWGLWFLPWAALVTSVARVGMACLQAAHPVIFHFYLKCFSYC